MGYVISMKVEGVINHWNVLVHAHNVYLADVLHHTDTRWNVTLRGAQRRHLPDKTGMYGARAPPFLSGGICATWFCRIG